MGETCSPSCLSYDMRMQINKNTQKTLLETDQERRRVAVALLQSWIDDGDEAEQRETGNALIKGLDANRLSNRPLFPKELEGVTW